MSQPIEVTAAFSTAVWEGNEHPLLKSSAAAVSILVLDTAQALQPTCSNAGRIEL